MCGKVCISLYLVRRTGICLPRGQSKIYFLLFNVGFVNIEIDKYIVAGLAVICLFVFCHEASHLGMGEVFNANSVLIVALCPGH